MSLTPGRPPPEATILSLHEGDWAKLRGDAILKLAVEVNSFAELKKGHDWWLQDPDRRAFLPRSKDGRWQWYRALYGPRMPVHYLREGDGSMTVLVTKDGRLKIQIPEGEAQTYTHQKVVIQFGKP